MLNIGIQVSPARADKPDAFSAITDTADRICGFVAAQGETDSIKVTGEVRAELSGLAKRLASIGVSGTGDIASSKYQGVLQNDLPSALKSVLECKLKVFDKLLAIVFSGTTQSSGPGAPNAVVNPVQQKCIELADQVMTEKVSSGLVTHSGKDVAQKAAETMKALGCASVLPGTTQSSGPGAPTAVVNPIQQKCIELADQFMTRSATSGMQTSYGEDIAQRAAETMKALGCASAGR